MRHFPWSSDVNRIIIGCGKLVEYLEEKLYDRKFRLPKRSDSYLGLLSINERSIYSGDNQYANAFRRKDVKDWLPYDLQNINPSVINRHLNWHIKIHTLKRQVNDVWGRPGRPGKNNNEILSGPKKYYSRTLFIDYLQKLVCQKRPRTIIYGALRQSRILERFLTLCEFKKLLKTKYSNIENMITESNAINPIHESLSLPSHFKGKVSPYMFISRMKSYYTIQQNLLLHESRKKNILLKASEKAKLYLQVLDWNDKIYTRFFIAGYYQV